MICEHLNRCVGYVYGLRGRGKQLYILVTINEILFVEPFGAIFSVVIILVTKENRS